MLVVVPTARLNNASKDRCNGANRAQRNALFAPAAYGTLIRRVGRPFKGTSGSNAGSNRAAQPRTPTHLPASGKHVGTHPDTPMPPQIESRNAWACGGCQGVRVPGRGD